MLGVNFESRFNFDYHVNTILKRTSKMDTNRRRVLLNAFIKSQFSYCPLIWMFLSRTLNNRINKIHEKALRLVYKDFSHLMNC